MAFERKLPFEIKAAAQLLREPSTMGTALLAIAMTAYGDAFFGNSQAGIEAIDPIELYTRLEEDFNAELSPTAENRLQAIKMAVETDGFYEDPLVFTSIALALASGDIGNLPDGILEELTLSEALWAAFEVALVRDDDIKFTPQILAVIDALIDAEADDEGPEEGPSNERFLRDQKFDLARQMLQLGVTVPELGAMALMTS